MGDELMSGPGLAAVNVWLERSAVLLTLWVVLSVGVDVVRRALGRPSGRNWRETAVNFLAAGPNLVVTGVLFGAVASVTLVAAERLAPVSWGLSPLSWLLAFVVVDLTYYLSHRLEHRVRLLWAHHSVHHSSPAFDLSTSTRLAWHDSIMPALYLVPAVLCGFHPGQVIVLYQVVVLYQTWAHTTAIGRVPLLEGILNTPSAHRVHHAQNTRYIDANHGGVLMIWDRLFGTYVAEDDADPPRFGVTTPPPPPAPGVRGMAAHMLAVHVDVYAHIGRELRAARSWSERALALFGPPEWDRHRGVPGLRAGSWWRPLLLALLSPSKS